jgi:hypothetical protein
MFLVTSQVFFGAVQCSVGCSWTDAAPNFSSSFNSLGNHSHDEEDDNHDDDDDVEEEEEIDENDCLLINVSFIHSSIHLYNHLCIYLHVRQYL